MAGLSTGNRTGKPAQREQEILTPQSIIDICNTLWGRIVLDPCWCENALTDPIHKFQLPAQDGLLNSWLRYTFINPPYKDLQAWLAHGLLQPLEQIWLVPVRTHRTWWRQWRDRLDAYCELNPIKFVGYEQMFPAPLLLGYRGAKPEEFLDAINIGGGLYTRREDD